MANLLITMIGIFFAAALAVAGISYINPTAFTEHNQASSNNAQVEALVTDYANLTRSLGHRPSTADYQAEFPASSANSQYNYASASSSGSNLSSGSSLGNNGGKWTYMPNCASGASDCFCIKIADGSPTTYKSAQMSALHQMVSSSSSRIEFSTSQCDDSSATTDPRSWAASTPSSYYLTVRMNAGSITQTTNSTVYTYTAQYTPFCPEACGYTTQVINSYTCVRSDGVTVSNTLCSAPVPGPCYDTGLCSASGSVSLGLWGPCVNGSQTQSWTCMVGNVTVPQSQCTAPASSSITRSCTSTAPPSSYTYSVSNPQYGTCQAACGNSTAPVTSWSCLRSDGTTVDQSNCTNAGVTPAATQACSSYSTCVASSPVYGTCSSTCGSGSQRLQSFTCSDGSNNTVDSSHCTSPPATQTCTSTASCTYTATASTYQGCSPACGTSVALPSAWTCTQSDGTTVSQSVCLAHGVSPTSSSCSDFSLCTPENVSYASTCSNQCGTGTEALQPTWTCGFLTQTTDKSKCTAPAATQACTSYAGCGYTASAPTAYGACSTTCGTGTQTATAFTCTRSDGTVVPQSDCTAPTQSCTSTSVCIANPGYGTCSTTCGTGTQTLSPTWTCTDSKGNPAPSRSYCSTPAAVQTCTGTSGCSYLPSVGGDTVWGACSTTCGVGTQTATTYDCTRSDGTPEPQGDCAAPTRACTSTSQCIPHYSLSACSTTCGTGTQSILPSFDQCTDSNGNAAPISDCTFPIGLQSCTVTSGCTYTVSNPSNYGSCSTTCGTGTATAGTFTCTRSDGTVVAQSNCSAPTESCTSTAQCITGNVSYGACNTTCGTGTQALNSTWTCKDSHGNAAPSKSDCTSPPATQSCSATSGCSYTASAPTAWGSCSTTCGNGTQSATAFTCTRSDGTPAPLSDCTAPTQACNSTSQCIAHASYGACTATCGSGTQPLNAGWTCTDSNGNAAPSTSYCTPPANNQTCSSSVGCTYTASDPTSFGACSTTCGTGTQVATGYTCTRSDGTVVAQNLCTAPTQSCTATSGCAETYSIVNVVYSGTCAPADCGSTSEYPVTSYQCQSSPGGQIVDNSYCDPQTPEVHACTNYASCFTYTASSPTYGTCFPSCNGTTPTGTQSLPTMVDPDTNLSYTGGFTCTRNDGNTVQDSEPGCQQLVGTASLPNPVSCTPATPATCH